MEKNKKSLLIISAVAILILVGAGSFFSGVAYGKSKVGSFNRAGAFGQGNMAGANNFQGGNNSVGRTQKNSGGFLSGEITAKSDNSLTVKTANGSSKIILISNESKISKAADASVSDLNSGTQILVTGTSNTDGTLTAKTIQINSGDAAIQPPSTPNNQTGVPQSQPGQATTPVPPVK